MYSAKCSKFSRKIVLSKLRVKYDIRFRVDNEGIIFEVLGGVYYNKN